MALIQLRYEALIHNLDIIAHQVGGKAKIAAVLKDNAYGHGARLMASALQHYGITRAVVRLEREAHEIAPYFEEILILSDLPQSPQAHFVYTLNTLEHLVHFPPQTRLHLKIDTGMHRNGIDPATLEEAFAQMADHEVRCEGIMTHFRSAEVLSSEWFWQRHRFDTTFAHAEVLAQRYGYTLVRHASNSAATFRGPCRDDFVRVGIAMYGCLQMEEGLESPPLRPILSLWGDRIATRTLHAGQKVGYNGRYEASHDERISTYDLGYANGLNRLASNRYITPEGIAQRGTISMDSASFSTDAQRIVIFDDANVYAQAVGTIGYEILACLDPNLPRVWEGGDHE